MGTLSAQVSVCVDARIVVPVVQHPGHPAAATWAVVYVRPGDWTTTSDRTSSKVVNFGRLVDDVKQTGKPDWSHWPTTGLATWRPMKPTMLADQAAALR